MEKSRDRIVTVRRSLEQAKHCVEEALSVVEHRDDHRCAVDDVEQAIALLVDTVLPQLRISAIRIADPR